MQASGEVTAARRLTRGGEVIGVSSGSGSRFDGSTFNNRKGVMTDWRYAGDWRKGGPRAARLQEHAFAGPPRTLPNCQPSDRSACARAHERRRRLIQPEGCAGTEPCLRHTKEQNGGGDSFEHEVI
jgi:hypothetical protein